jgi:hypothetical protein
LELPNRLRGFAGGRLALTILGTSTRCGVTAPMEAGSSRKRRRRGSGLSGGRPTSGSNVVGNEKSRKRCGVSGRPPALEARRPGDRVVDKLAPNSLAAGGPLDVCGVDAGPRYCFPRGAAPEPTTCTFEKRRRRRKRLARIVAPRARRSYPSPSHPLGRRLRPVGRWDGLPGRRPIQSRASPFTVPTDACNPSRRVGSA